MTTRPLDTDQASWAEYNALLDGMNGEARIRAAMELSQAIRDVRLAGIQARHPELTRRQAIAHLVREELGVSLPPSR